MMTKKEIIKNLDWLWCYEYGIFRIEERENEIQKHPLCERWSTECDNGDCDWIFPKWLLKRCREALKGGE